MRRRKFKPTFEKDYNFYFTQRHVFTFAGSDISAQYNIQFSENGKTAKECFHKLDSEGKLLPCSEPQLLLELLTCKAAINLQIKLWAESRAEYTLSLKELQEYMEYYQCPEWVLRAVENQKIKIITKWDDATKKKLFDAVFLNLAEELENERPGEKATRDSSDSVGAGDDVLLST